MADTSFVKGDASAGLGVAAAGDTTVFDGFRVAILNGAGQSTVQIRGRLYVESRTVEGKTASARRTISLYPDTTAADADDDGSGDGALFHGAIEVTSSPNQVPLVRFLGGFSGSDFSIQTGPGNRLTISTSTLNKIIPGVADTGAVVIRTESGAVSPSLPLTRPILAAIVALLLGGTGIAVLRRPRLGAGI